MSTPGRLLEVQALDLEADALRRKRKTLPERETLVSNEEEHTALVTQRAEVQARHDALARAERELGGEVESIANKARDVEANLYSGTVTVPKELDGLQQELALLKGKQDEAEGRELELLEQIEAVDAELAALIERGDALETQAAALRESITAAEGVLDEEIAGLGGSVSERREGLAESLLAAYDRLRADARLGGRAAVALESKTCGGCQLDLPVLEYKRIREEAEDAVVTCVHCRRLFIR